MLLHTFYLIGIRQIHDFYQRICPLHLYLMKLQNKHQKHEKHRHHFLRRGRGFLLFVERYSKGYGWHVPTCCHEVLCLLQLQVKGLYNSCIQFEQELSERILLNILQTKYKSTSKDEIRNQENSLFLTNSPKYNKIIDSSLMFPYRERTASSGMSWKVPDLAGFRWILIRDGS